MTVYEYLTKAAEICDDFEDKKGCKECPLMPFGCGIARKEEIDTVLEIVENYEAKNFPFGRCRSCTKEFNSELISEYDIKHCPWCGAKIED